MGEVLTQVWLKSVRDECVIGEQSECIKREFEKYFRGSCKLPQAHEKVCDENETDARVKILLMEVGLS